MNIKVVICNCNGLKFMPEGVDMNTLPFELENDADIKYAVVHPQLCGRGGSGMLDDLLRGAAPDDYFVIAGCGPDNQSHFLGHIVDGARFPNERFKGVSIRGMDNAQARAAILEAVGELLARRGETVLADNYSG